MVLGPVSLSPWVYFNKLWTSLKGYPADEFTFVPGKTPFSTLGETVFMIVLYLCVVFGGREWMRNRPAYKLNTLFKIHNFCLTAISGTLLVLFAEQIIPTVWKNGLYNGICGSGGWTDPLVTLYYVRTQKPISDSIADSAAVELLDQICRTPGHSLSVPQEEALE